MSVDLKSIKGEKLISNPAGSVRNLQPVAIFLYSKLYAVVWTTKKMGGLKPPVLNLIKIYLNGGAYKIPP